MKKSDEERTKERFHEILSKYPLEVYADLDSGMRGRGLFANRSFKAGDVTVAVPLEFCIFHEIDLEDVKYEDGQVVIDAAGNISDLDKKRIAWTSEIALTGKLMEVLEKAAFDGTGFWSEYWWLFPTTDSKEIPSNLTRAMLEEFATVDPHVSLLLLDHRAKLRAAWEKLKGTGGVPPVLFWANSMVLSRCFHFWDQQVDGKKRSRGGLVPFIDLLNHDREPNCRLIQHGDRICAEACRDIEAGEELTHPYARNVPNLAIFTRFGFVEQNNEEDRVSLPPSIPAIPRKLVLEILEQEDSSKYTERALLSLERDERSQGGDEGGGGEQGIGISVVEDASEIEDVLLVLSLELQRQLKRFDNINENCESCIGFKPFVEERRKVVLELLTICRDLAEKLDVTLPGEEEAEAVDTMIADPSASNFLDNFFGRDTSEQPDIYSLLAPRTEEELAEYNSDDEGGGAPEVSSEGQASVLSFHLEQQGR
uniref:SET domain-containing protein n=1 Tax=Guillardia theta TaxID=55529 RepID=A0A7S4KTB5_GUITH|mmetsp:Transcript_30717/g.98813  ORF Transcript_30717/g.98813 Transcript_30717/m.98813 type:complete len:481 (+) Transcript_30717:43-1485(+)